MLRRALLALVLLAGWRCTNAEAASLPPLLRDLTRSAGEYRSVAPRLSISRGYAPCREAPPPADGTVTRAECPALPPDLAKSRSFKRVVREAREAGVDPVALHASALADVATGGSGSALDNAVATLQTAARLSEERAPLLADLAAAFLVLAETRQTPGDLDRALEVAQEAIELDSTNLGALYNRALALERIGLPEGADDAWRRYLAVDSTSGWANEARARLRDDPTIDVTPPAKPSPETAAEFARRLPQQANAWGWEVLLPAWAAALEGDRTAAADSALRLADSVGQALASARRDASLADAVAAIRAAGPAARARLARAHHAYAEGRRLYDAADRFHAATWFQRATEDAGSSPALWQWARLFYTASLASAGRPDGEPGIRQIVQEADSIRYPALAGRARWMMGTLAGNRGEYVKGRSWYLRSVPILERAGEDEHTGFVRYVASLMLQYLGNEPAADQERHRMMLRMRPYSRSLWRHAMLFGAAENARDQGLHRTALHYHAEDVRVSARTWQPYYNIEARLGRARLLGSLGHTEAALADLRAAEPVVDSLKTAPARTYFRNDLWHAEAEVILRSRPDSAVARLDSVVSYFAGNPTQQIPPLLLRAEAHLASRHLGKARADLQTAARLILQLGASVNSIPLRSTLFARARGIFDRLVLAQVNAGDHTEALVQLEQARAVFAPFPARASGRVRVPAGEVGLEFVMVADTLLAWTVAGDSVRFARQTVDRAGLLRQIELARSSLERGRGGAQVQDALAALYDALIRPVEARLGIAGQGLVVVADGSLAGVPFSALYDRQRGRYLLEDRAVRMAATLSGPATRHSPRPPARALLVADPAFDAAAHPGFARLRGAVGEVDSILPLYASPVRLAGFDADSARVSAAWPRAELVHFAGHAVLDDARPERSYLLLAGSGGAARMTAEEIGGMNLRRVRLVVLSACETARGADGRSGGLAGLSGALIGAGAQGVVGSLWRVDDQHTRELMVAFHRAYIASGDAAAALRASQLALLRSSDPRLRSPAAWGGFVHISG